MIATGVRPSEVPRGEIFESCWLIDTGQLAGPYVQGWIYVSAVLGEACENQAIAGARVPVGLSVLDRIWPREATVSETLHSCKVVAEDGTKGMANVDDLRKSLGDVW